jgi:hypothetical protein
VQQYGAIIDYIENVGLWVSDGNNYFYHTQSLDGIPVDLPGVIRAVKSYPNRMVINNEFYESISSGYYLLSMAAGCVDSYHIISDSLSPDRDIKVEDAKYLQIPYRGDNVGAISVNVLA